MSREKQCPLCYLIIDYTTNEDWRHYINDHYKKDHKAVKPVYVCKKKSCGCGQAIEKELK